MLARQFFPYFTFETKNDVCLHHTLSHQSRHTTQCKNQIINFINVVCATKVAARTHIDTHKHYKTAKSKKNVTPSSEPLCLWVCVCVAPNVKTKETIHFLNRF